MRNAGKMAIRGYVICTEARSGSEFLRVLLRSTGRLGDPREFLAEAGILRSAKRGEIVPVTETASPNGVYGLKLFSFQLSRLSGAGFVSRLPNLHWVHLERRDLLGQAISFERAAQTGRYEALSAADLGQPPKPLVYNRRGIQRKLAFLAAGQARWRCYFARNAISPLNLFYEDVVQDPQAAVDAVADLVGVAEPTPIEWATVNRVIQRDQASEQWRAQFLSDAADLDSIEPAPMAERLRDAAGRLWRAVRPRQA